MYYLIDKFSLILMFFLILFGSCTKSAGVGGQAVIKGEILVHNFNALGNPTGDSYEAQEHDIYIIYGDNDNTYDDDMKTSYDGTFEFKYLYPGNYEVFTYSECLTCPNGQDSLIKLNVTINSNKEINELETIDIANY